MERVELEVFALRGSQEIGRYTLVPGIYTLGRSSVCDLSIPADLISRQHARLSFGEDGSLTIEDLNSANGTLLDGQPIIGITSFEPNQTLELGTASLLIQRRVPSSSDVSLASVLSEDEALPQELQRPERYSVGDEIAKGGMGAILSAREHATRRTVAMKVMLGQASESPRHRLRFIEEGQITAQLEHPNIVPVHELGVHSGTGQPFYTMKMVKGITLKKILELLTQGTPATVEKYPLPALLTIFQKVCDAIAFAHSKGVIHRDLKPANIMVGYFGEVLVMDWGLAKIIERKLNDFPASLPDLDQVQSARQDEGDAYSTLDGSIMGTPHYMAPEQARGEVEKLDARADIFALGAILYELLTLQRPFRGKNAREVIAHILNGEPPVSPARVVNTQKGKSPKHLPGGEVPGSLSAVCMKALQLNPENRYSSVKDLQADLTAYQNGFATSAEDASAWKQALLFIKRNKAIAFGTAAALTVALIFGSGAVVQGRRATKALTELRAQAPQFASMADTLVEQLNLTAALEKLDGALKLDPENGKYHARRGDILQTQLKMEESVKAYDRAIGFGVGDERTKASRAISAQLADVAGRDLTAQELTKLTETQTSQGRLAEAVLLAPRLAESRATQMALFKARIESFLDLKNSVSRGVNMSPRPDGLYSVSLDLVKTTERTLEGFRGMPVYEIRGVNYVGGDLRPLSGTPIEILNLPNSRVTRLEGLSGTPLRVLSLNQSPLQDLHGIEGCPLETLSIVRTKVVDISPLKGLPLRSLSLNSTHVRDLSPLKGAPLEELDIGSTQVSDLSPLRGAKLKYASLGGTKITSLEALRGMPIEKLGVQNTAIEELSPLEGMPLRMLSLSSAIKVNSLAYLRGLPLESLNLRAAFGVENFEPLRGLKLRALDLQATSFKDGSVLAGQPLESLLLADCRQLKDISFLKTLPKLKALSLPKHLVEAARGLPSLQYLTTKNIVCPGDNPAFESVSKVLPTVVQFWKNPDAY